MTNSPQWKRCGAILNTQHPSKFQFAHGGHSQGRAGSDAMLAGKGGAEPYRPLADALESSGRLAVPQMVSRGKEELVLIRPYQKGLVLHTMFYADESEIQRSAKADKVKVSKQEVNAGVGLIDNLINAACTVNRLMFDGRLLDTSVRIELTYRGKLMFYGAPGRN